MLQKLESLRHLLFFKLSVIYLRYLIGFAFVWASIVKIRGERFTTISVTEPVGYFFEAMYQSGFYWNFLGWGQFIAGALLMTQRFASFGAMVFFPIILNICVITWSVNFGSGTPVITLLMLLGTLGLLVWDYRRWMILFQYDHQIKLDLTSQPRDSLMTDPVWAISGVFFVLLILGIQLIPGASQWIGYWLILMMLTGLVASTIAIRNLLLSKTPDEVPCDVRKGKPHQ
ncbi:MAG: DoxX family protein [Azospira oryzae]|jgi:hypothetical protein|nr:MAG: DoxX family protein [Azospira oryzae]